MTQIAHIFHGFEGSWKFHRVISTQGNAEGIAQFTPRKADKDCLDYREDGTFYANNGKTYKIFREYLYRLEKDTISVYFAEKPPRLMHTLEFIFPTLKSAKALHQCDCDLYEGFYEFDFPEAFNLSYSVKGPKKNYTISTRFERAANLN